MTDSLRLMLRFAVRGFRDSLLGCLELYRLEKSKHLFHENLDTDAQPLSTLARRRAVKKEQSREQKKNK